MSTLKVEVLKVEKVVSHPEADRLDLCYIKGWQTVSQRGQFKEGDLCVYFPIDAVLPADLVRKLGIEKFYNKRLRTVKLRNRISQGLVIRPEVLELKVSEGDDLTPSLGVTKYEPPIPTQMQGVIVPEHPLFQKFTSIENYKNYPTAISDGEWVVLTEKVHGCLAASTSISLADGTWKSIGEIVNKKLKVEVLGMDKDGRLVPTKITNWFNNGENLSTWKKVVFTRKRMGNGNSWGRVVCTPNHEFFDPKGKVYKTCSSLKKGDSVLCRRKDIVLTYTQEQILTGIMLGDGSLNNRSVNFCHKKEHESYIDFTLQSLGDVAGEKSKETTGEYGTILCHARSRSFFPIEDLFSKWFSSGKKEIPKDIQLTPISLAFWYMDDGSLSHSDGQHDRVMFATAGFSRSSVVVLQTALSRLGINSVIQSNQNKHRKYWNLRINADDADKLFVLISPYVPPCMQYKLPERYRSGQPAFLLTEPRNVYKENTIEQTILSIEDCEPYSARYDLETETHNYIADDLIVHNSNARALMVDGQLHVGGHNRSFAEDKTNLYWRGAELLDLKTKLQDREQIFFEIYGSGVQDLSYGKKNGHIGVAIIGFMKSGQFLDYKDSVNVATERGWKSYMAPCISICKWHTDHLYHVDGNSVLDPTQIKEGLVVTPLKERFSEVLQGRAILKIISDQYLLRHDKDATEYH